MFSSTEFPTDLRPVLSIAFGSYARIVKYESYSGFIVAGKHQNLSRCSQIETEILKKIDSERIVQFYGEYTRRDNNRVRHIILMEFCDISLKLYQVQFNQKLRDPYIFRSIAAQLVEGLCAIHDAGYIHCDLNTSNVLFKYNKIKICDFGMSRRIDDNVPYGAIGTYGLLAPETMLGLEVTSKCDVWSLGCLLHYLITGKMPFSNFSEKNRGLLMANIGNEIGFPDKFCRSVSAYTRSSDIFDYKKSPFLHLQKSIGYSNWHFLYMCLRTDPDERPSSREIFDHATFNEFFNGTLIPYPKLRERKPWPNDEECLRDIKAQFDANLL